MQEAQWHMTDDAFITEHLLTVAGAAHVGCCKQLRVSRLTAHQKDTHAPKRTDYKRRACSSAKTAHQVSAFLNTFTKRFDEPNHKAFYFLTARRTVTYYSLYKVK